MYRALESFTTKNYDVKRKQILEDDFTNQAEIQEFLNIGYIEEYDGSLEITENGIYDVEDYETADVNVSGGGGFPPDWSEIGYEETPSGVMDEFNYAKDIKDNWDSSITSMYKKYESNNDLTIFPSVDTSNVTTMNKAFYYCTNLKNILLLDTSNVTEFEQAFFSCIRLKEIPFFNTGKITNMYQAFYNCQLIKTIPPFDTGKVNSFSSCFEKCNDLENVPILDMSSIYGTGHLQMFAECNSLTDESLNNILQMCINATSRIGSSYRILRNLGINNTTVYPVSRIEALSNYQDFINAGWTIGY